MKLPVNRGKKEVIFLINGAAIPSGGEMLVLHIADALLWLWSVSVLGSG